MSNIDLLKTELINQKNAIIAKGGTVPSIHTYPSPSEITTAINNIPETDLSASTATESDVTTGKTFYSGNSTLKTGTNSNDATINAIYKKFIGGSDHGTYSGNLPSGITKIRTYAFAGNSSSSGLFIGPLVIPEGITTIENNAFQYCGNLTSVSFPSTLITMGNYCFSYCSGLTSITIPDSVTTAGTYMFAAITNVTSIYIGTGITNIPLYTIRDIPLVTTIDIPANIATINSNNLVNILGATNMYLHHNSTLLKGIAFTQKNTNLCTWVNFEAIPYYYSATNWVSIKSTLISEVTIAANDPFPTLSNSTITLRWHSSIEDAKANTNVLSAPTGAGTYYCKPV